jgi:hypothetical protein
MLAFSSDQFLSLHCNQGCHTERSEAFWRAGGRAGGRPYPLHLIWTRRGTVDREIIVPNLLYCSNFSYCCPPTWSHGGWQSKVSTEVRRRPSDPSNLPWVVNQRPFDPYRAGAKVYREYQANERPAPQTTLIAMNPLEGCRWPMGKAQASNSGSLGYVAKTQTVVIR